MFTRRAVYISLLGSILIWSAYLCCGMAYWQDMSSHETACYWPPWDSWSNIFDAWHSDHLESNGILEQLFYYIFWDHLFAGITLLGLRLPSILGSLGSIVLLFLIGKELGNRRLGIIAAFLFAVNTLQISIAVHCRFFAGSTFFMLLSTWFLLRICKPMSNNKKAGFGLWLGYALSLTASICSMVLNLFFVPLHAIIYLGKSPRHKGDFVKAFTILLVGFSVFGILYKRDLGAVSRFNYPSSIHEWKSIGYSLITNGFSRNQFLGEIYLDRYYECDRYINIQACLTAALLLFALIIGIWQAWRQRKLTNSLVIDLLMCGFVTEWVTISLAIKPLTVVTNTSSLWPLIALAIALTLSGNSIFSRSLRTIFLAMMFITTPMTCYNTFLHARQAHQMSLVFKTYFRPGDVAIIHDHDEIDPIWLTGFAPRKLPIADTERLRYTSRLLRDLAHGKNEFPNVISVKSGCLLSMPALILQNCAPGQRFWVFAHIGDCEPERLAKYLNWFLDRDVKYYVKQNEAVFVFFTVNDPEGSRPLTSSPTQRAQDR